MDVRGAGAGGAPGIASSSRADAVVRTCGLLLIFLVPRILYAALVPFRFGDVNHYLDQTTMILAGRVEELDPYWFLGYFLFVLPLAWLGLSTYWAALLSGFVFSLLGGLAIYRLGTSISGDARIGRRAFLLYSIHPLSVQYAASSGMENFCAAAFLIGTMAMLSGVEGRWVSRRFAGGMAYGFATLLRNETIFLALVAVMVTDAVERGRTELFARFSRSLLAPLPALLGLVLVLVCWVHLTSAWIRGPVLFAKLEVIHTEMGRGAVVSPEDREAWAREVIAAKLGEEPPRVAFVTRVARNLVLLPRTLVKAFVSPLLPLLAALAVLKPYRSSLSRRRCGVVVGLMLLAGAAYVPFLLEARYLYLSVALSFAPAAVGYAWVIGSSERVLVRVIAFVGLPLLLVLGVGARIYREYPRGLSSVGLEQVYASSVPGGSLVYSPFGQVPTTVTEFARTHAISHQPLPFVTVEGVGSLVPPGRSEVFVFVDSYYIESYFPEGRFLEEVLQQVGRDGTEISRIARLDRSPRNRGFLLRVARPDPPITDPSG